MAQPQLKGAALLEQLDPFYLAVSEFTAERTLREARQTLEARNVAGREVLHLAAALALLRLHRYDEAVQHLVAGRPFADRPFVFLVNIGHTHCQSGQFEKAIPFLLDAARELDAGGGRPSDLVVVSGCLAESLARAGRWSAATAALATTERAADPAGAGDQFRLAEAYAAMERWQDAAAALGRCFALDRGMPIAADPLAFLADPDFMMENFEASAPLIAAIEVVAAMRSVSVPARWTGAEDPARMAILVEMEPYRLAALAEAE